MTASLQAKPNGTQAALLVNAAEAFSFDTSGVDSPISITASASAGALTVVLTKGGWRFRNASLTNGIPTYVKTDTDLSIVVPSTSNLGRVVSAGTNNLVALVANSGGSLVLCVVNIAGGVNLDETNLLSPTTISGASSSATVVYSSGTVAANSPYRVVGAINVVFTDGTGWANPTLVQPFMGNALGAMQSLGYGQTWQSVTRNAGTTYYNTTGRPIKLNFSLPGSAAALLQVNGITVVSTSTTTGTGGYGEAIIPAGASYLFTTATNLVAVVELR